VSLLGLHRARATFEAFPRPFFLGLAAAVTYINLDGVERRKQRALAQAGVEAG